MDSPLHCGIHLGSVPARSAEEQALAQCIGCGTQPCRLRKQVRLGSPVALSVCASGTILQKRPCLERDDLRVRLRMRSLPLGCLTFAPGVRGAPLRRDSLPTSLG